MLAINIRDITGLYAWLRNDKSGRILNRVFSRLTSKLSRYFLWLLMVGSLGKERVCLKS